MNCLITQFGKPLDKSLYVIDEKNKTFSTKEDNLVLNFIGLDDWTFKTGSRCTFKTGSHCTFKTSSNCTFNTLRCCTFITEECCTFNTDAYCTFNTLWDCTFKTSSNCTFITSSCCTFHTRCNCVFNICDDFKKIETKGHSTILIKNKKIHTYLKEEIELYYENDEILYTENKLTKDKYLMMKELIK